MRASSARRFAYATVAAAAIVLLPAPAAAHLNATGLGPVYDGVAHFLTSPEDLLAVLALALWAGGRGARCGRQVLFVLPTAWLLGAFAGTTSAASAGSAVVAALWLVALGALLAVDVALPLALTTALTIGLGLQRGCLNGAGVEPSWNGITALLGLASSVFVVVALAAAFAVRLRAAWVRVAARVLGSWIAAGGLLLLGWSMRGRP